MEPILDDTELQFVKMINDAQPSNRVQLFLNLVIRFKDRLKRTNFETNYCWDEQYVKDVLSDEQTFIATYRKYFSAISKCQKSKEIYKDMVTRHLVNYAARSYRRPLALIGDFNHIYEVAMLYRDNKINGFSRLAIIYCVRQNADKRVIEGSTLLIILNAANALSVQGGTVELNDAFSNALDNIHPLDSFKTIDRARYLKKAVNLMSTCVPTNWHITAENILDGEHIHLNSQNEFPYPIDRFVVHPFGSIASFYESAYITRLILSLSPSEQAEVVRLLDVETIEEHRPALHNAALDAIYTSEHEDVFRVLFLVHTHANVAAMMANTA